MNLPTVALEEQSFLVLSDIHANAQALEEVLRIAPPTRYKCFLGDAVGYGDQPREVLEVLKEFDVAIAGNHDTKILNRNEGYFTMEAARIIEQHRKKLRRSDCSFLNGLVKSYSRSNIILFHGTPECENEYLFNDRDILKMVQRNPQFDIFFGGHFHFPRLARISKEGEIEFEEISHNSSIHTLDLRQYRYVINCPSVTPGRGSYEKSGGSALYHREGDLKSLHFFFV